MAKKEKVELKTIHVKPETYKELLKIGALFQLEIEERVSMDDIIQELIGRFPQTTVRLEDSQPTTSG